MNYNLELEEELDLIGKINRIEKEISMAGLTEEVLLDKISEIEKKILSQSVTNKIIKLSSINTKKFDKFIKGKFDPKIDRLYKELNLLMNLTRMRIIKCDNALTCYFISSSRAKVESIDSNKGALHFWRSLMEFLTFPNDCN